MLLKRVIEFQKSLSLRLTLWYMGTFVIISCAAFFFFYLLIISVISEGTDRELLTREGRFSRIYEVQGVAGVTRAAIQEARGAGEKQVFCRLLYPTGEAFSSSNMSYWQNIGVGGKAIRKLSTEGRRVFETLTIEGREDSVRILYGFMGPGIILQLGQSLDRHKGLITAFSKVFVRTMAALILVAALIGGFMVRRAVAGVSAVTKTARRISGGDLAQRVPVGARGDEIDQLALTFNQMLDRIHSLVTGTRQMSDNIAHDLKSPVTRIRGHAEVTLLSGGTLGDYETMAASTIEDCDRLLDMINTMLVISRTEAGADSLDLSAVAVARVVESGCDLFQSAADAAGVTLTCRTEGSETLPADRRMIQRMIANLIDNAIKYTPEGGTVAVELSQEEAKSAFRLTVRDTGIGIADSELPRIFERFYRCDGSRSSTGMGLGLCLAKTIASAHGGEVTVRSAVDAGCTFTVILPKEREEGGDV